MIGSNIVLGGAGTNRDIQIVPSADQSAQTSTIVVTVTDNESKTATETFTVTVAPVSVSANGNSIAPSQLFGFGLHQASELASRTFTITNPSSDAITITSVSAPDGFRVANGFTAGQSLAAGASVDVEVELNRNPGKSAGPLRIEIDNGAPAAFEFQLSGTVLAVGETIQDIGDGDLGFSTTGAWNQLESSIYAGGSTHFLDSDQAAGTATHSFDVIPGTYDVFSTWPTTVSNGTTVPYTIRDSDGTAILNKSVDQTARPSDLTHEGFGFQKIGTVSASGETLFVDVTNEGAGGRAYVDDVVLRMQGPLGDDVIVTVDGAVPGQGVEIPNGSYFGFGSHVESFPSQTFSVTNNKTTAITVTNLFLPVGFVPSGFNAQTLAPGASMSFVVSHFSGTALGLDPYGQKVGNIGIQMVDGTGPLGSGGVHSIRLSSTVLRANEIGQFIDDGDDAYYPDGPLDNFAHVPPPTVTDPNEIIVIPITPGGNTDAGSTYRGDYDTVPFLPPLLTNPPTDPPPIPDAQADYVFDVQPGVYRVYATWGAGTGLSLIHI